MPKIQQPAFLQTADRSIGGWSALLILYFSFGQKTETGKKKRSLLNVRTAERKWGINGIGNLQCLRVTLWKSYAKESQNKELQLNIYCKTLLPISSTQFETLVCIILATERTASEAKCCTGPSGHQLLWSWTWAVQCGGYKKDHKCFQNGRDIFLTECFWCGGDCFCFFLHSQC